jgi:hypothetical protein
MKSDMCTTIHKGPDSVLMSGDMSRFRIGDRVEITGELSQKFASRIGIITASEGASSAKNFIVALADGAEFAFSPSQLIIPPPTSADLIFDTRVSPGRKGARGATPGRHLRFVCRDFDIHLKLAASDKENSVIGQITENGRALKASLITLLFGSKPYARTATDALGEFHLHQVRTGSAMLEIMVPSHRILAPFDISPA